MRGKLDNALELADHGPSKRLEVHTRFVFLFVGKDSNARAKVRIELDEFLHSRPGDAHDDDKQIALRRLHDSVDHTHSPDVIEIYRSRRIDPLIALSENDQHSITLLDVIDEFDRAFAADRQRDDGVWKNNGITNRKNRQLIRYRLDLLLNVIKLFEVTFHGSPGKWGRSPVSPFFIFGILGLQKWGHRATSPFSGLC